MPVLTRVVASPAITGCEGLTLAST